MCYQGVWFSGKSASGPWEVASTVPKEIYQIPVSSPAHHVTYVTVEDDNDDEWVDVCRAAGLHRDDDRLGLRGLGQRLLYPPYWGYGAYYPYTILISPLTDISLVQPVDRWIRAQRSGLRSVGGAGVGARYNPRTGRCTRRRRLRSVRRARRRGGLQPPHGHLRGHPTGSNVYGSWGSTALQRGDDGPRPIATRIDRPATTTRTIRTDEGSAVTRHGPGGGTVGVGDGGNVYAGNDGNVYGARTGRGSSMAGRWSNTDRSLGTRPTTPHGGGAARRSGPRRASSRGKPIAARRSRHDGTIESRLRRTPRGRAADR